MKILILILLFLNLSLHAKSKILNAYVVSVSDRNFIEENVQKKRKTSKDYNGLIYSKVYVFGKLGHEKLRVVIGNSIGHLIKSRNITNKKRFIGKELTYKHYAVTEGFVKVSTKKKLYEKRVFVK